MHLTVEGMSYMLCYCTLKTFMNVARDIHQQLLNSESWSSILFYVKEEQYSLLLWGFSVIY